MHSLLELEALQAEVLLIIICMTLNELLTTQTYNVAAVNGYDNISLSSILLVVKTP